MVCKYETYCQTGIKGQIIVGQVDTADIETISFKDTLHFYQEVQAQLLRFQNEGHLLANIDSTRKQGDTIKVFLYKGSVYRFAQLNLTSFPNNLLQNLNISTLSFENQIVSAPKIKGFIQRVLFYSENNGYPFASVSFQNVSQNEDGHLLADLVYEANQKIHLDSIEIRGDLTVDRKFLLTYLGLRQGQAYNEQALTRISKKIKELNFVQELSPWMVEFTALGTKLMLNLGEKRSNQINALVGFQPSNAITRRFQWTADVQLALVNGLGFGESFSASYKNLQINSPQFEVHTIFPFVQGSKFGLDAKFEFFRRDSLFNRTSFEGGLRYQLSDRDFVRLSYSTYTNRVPSPDTSFVRNTKLLGDNADVGSNGFGLGVFIDRTDFQFNPKKGWAFNLQITGLRRIVKKNDAVLSISDGYDYQLLYDSANQQSQQIKFNGSLHYYLPLAKSLSLLMRYEAAYLSGGQLFQNELYQIGGFKLLRGFDERSIYANHYHVGTLALKTILSQRSYFELFSDIAKIYTKYSTTDIKRTAWSLGTGLSLDNNNGVFNIALAVGKFDNQPFEFRNAKIHFGYITYF
jgi:outer membrane protein assembly factor BamA